MSASVHSRLILLSSARGAGGVFYGLNGQPITGNSSGAWAIAANGTNQNITLTPSGTGRVNVSVGANNGVSLYVAPSTQLSASNNVTHAVGDSLASGRATLFGMLRESGGNYVGILETFAGGAPLALNRSGGNVLLGTTTDSSNGKLQLATHTTSAGGIGFGTETSLFRAAAGQLYLDHVGGTTPTITLSESGTARAYFQYSGGIAYLATAGANSLILRTNNTAALTLDSSQNATFAQSAYAGGDFRASGPGALYWASRSVMRSPSTGVITLFNNAENDFSRLQFGGTTNGAPGLGRSGAALVFCRADGTVPINMLSGTGTPEAAVTAPVGSLFFRTDGGAGSTLYVKESGTGNTGWVAK